MMANMSPARPTFMGSTKLSVAAMATAASTALPPFLRMSRPTWAARGWLVVTMPLRAMVSERPWASHPSARSPRTALQKAGLEAGSLGLQVDEARSAAEPEVIEMAETAAKTARPRESLARVILFMNVSSVPSLKAGASVIGDGRKRHCLIPEAVFCGGYQRPS